MDDFEKGLTNFPPEKTLYINWNNDKENIYKLINNFIS